VCPTVAWPFCVILTCSPLRANYDVSHSGKCRALSWYPWHLPSSSTCLYLYLATCRYATILRIMSLFGNIYEYVSMYFYLSTFLSVYYQNFVWVHVISMQFWTFQLIFLLVSYLHRIWCNKRVSIWWWFDFSCEGSTVLHPNLQLPCPNESMSWCS